MDVRRIKLILPGTLLAAAVLALVLGLRALGFFVGTELTIYDYLVRWRSVPGMSPPAPVVLVGATEEDLRKLGWPLTDERLAQVVEGVLALGPRAVGIDLYRDLPVPPGEERLAKVLTGSDRVYAVTKLGGDGATAVPPPPALKDSKRVGFADVVVDPEGIVRRGLLYLEDAGRNWTGFALLLTLKYLEPQGIRPEAGDADTGAMKLGPTIIPVLEPDDGGYVGADAGGYQYLLDYARGASPFPRVSVTDVLEGRVPAALMKDKVVIVGVTAESVKDSFYTPFERGAGPGGAIYGIAMHGQAVDQLLRFAEGRTPVMRTYSEQVEYAWIVLWTLLGAVAAWFVRSPRWLAPMVAGGLALIGAASYAAFSRYAWLPVVPQAVGWLLSVGFIAVWLSWRERVERGELMQLFSRHLSGEIANDIWNRREEFLGGDGMPRHQRLTATILFSDIKGFTTVSEQLDPNELMDWLNRYMARMLDLVQRHHGTVNQLIGDAVMAVWGVPIPRATEAEIRQDAANAVDCALAMRDALVEVNRENAAHGLPPIEIRVGLYTGSMVTGALGGRERMQYTMIGDTVNTASRLESFKTAGEAPQIADDDRGCRILIGDATHSLVGDRYAVMRVGEVQLKGKEHAVTVYRVNGLKDGEETEVR